MRQRVVLANLEKTPRLSMNLYWELLAYFLFLGLWLARLYQRFRKPPGWPQASAGRSSKVTGSAF